MRIYDRAAATQFSYSPFFDQRKKVLDNRFYSLYIYFHLWVVTKRGGGNKWRHKTRKRGKNSENLGIERSPQGWSLERNQFEWKSSKRLAGWGSKGIWQLLASAPCSSVRKTSKKNNGTTWSDTNERTQIDDVDGGKRRDQGFHTTEGALREGQKPKMTTIKL